MNNVMSDFILGGAVVGLIVFGIMVDILRQASRALDDKQKELNQVNASNRFWMSCYFTLAYPTPAEEQKAPEAPVEAPVAQTQDNALQLPSTRFISYSPANRLGEA